MTLMVALVPILAFGVLLAIVTVPFVSLGPGPTFNTLGEYDGKQVVDIEGTDVKPTSGNLNMTTVSQRDELTLGQALALWMSGREQLVPRDLVYPPDKSRDDVDKANDADFKDSEDNAEYAALGFLNYAPAVTVADVNDPGPSAGKLHAGDAIDAVERHDGGRRRQVHLPAQGHQARDRTWSWTSAARTPRPGSPPSPSGPTRTVTTAIWGSRCATRRGRRFNIDFNLANIGGPSAGLMFSLAVIDKLTTGDLNDAKFVAGTGTITGDGKVGSHRRYHAQDGGRPRGRRDGVPGARRQLRRGRHRRTGRHAAGEGRHPRRSRRRVARAVVRSGRTALLRHDRQLCL